MNTHLQLALSRAQLIMQDLYKAEEDLYLDDAIRENDEAIMAIQNAIDKVEIVISGLIDDIDCEYHGINHKPKIQMITSFIGVVK